MNRNDGCFWLAFTPHWLRIVTVLGTVATGLPGLRRIDSALISRSDDWNVYGLTYLAGALLESLGFPSRQPAVARSVIHRNA